MRRIIFRASTAQLREDYLSLWNGVQLVVKFRSLVVAGVVIYV